MKIANVPFTSVDWSQVEPTVHPGDPGQAVWRTRQFGEIRVRMVEYSAGYVADHWCRKGHILLVLAGELITELADGRRITLRPGQSYQVEDETCPHRSTSPGGATLFIVD